MPKFGKRELAPADAWEAEKILRANLSTFGDVLHLGAGDQ